MNESALARPGNARPRVPVSQRPAARTIISDSGKNSLPSGLARRSAKALQVRPHQRIMGQHLVMGAAMIMPAIHQTASPTGDRATLLTTEEPPHAREYNPATEENPPEAKYLEPPGVNGGRYNQIK
jgi:hypothetical protein